jgi:PAS domain S-box-containing protein
MFKQVKIGVKIVVLVLLLVFISVSAISFLSFNFSKKAIQSRYVENLEILAKLRVNALNDYFSILERNNKYVTGFPGFHEALNSLEENQTEIITEDEIGELYSDKSIDWDHLLQPLLEDTNIATVVILDQSAQVKFSFGEARPEIGTEFLLRENDVPSGLSGNTVGNVFIDELEYYCWLVTIIEDNSGEPRGRLLSKVRMQPVYELLQDSTGLGTSGEVILAGTIGSKVTYLNPLRHDNLAALRKEVHVGEEKDFPIQDAVSGGRGAREMIDYRHKNTLAAWEPIPGRNWGLVAKIDLDEIYQETNLFFIRFSLAGIIILLASVLVTILFSKILTNPLEELKSTMHLLSKGILPQNVVQTTHDEFGEMANTMDHLVKGLRRTADFAHRIGEGDLKTDFVPLSDDDTLGTSLINMRNNIQEAEKRDKERNWIVTGMAEIGEILRRNDSIDGLGDEVTRYITGKIGAIQGAFYVLNDEEEDALLEMKASYAYGKKKYLKGSFRFAEGLVGQAAVEQDTLVRVEIPDEYVTITSGLLGDRRPKSLLIAPLITEEKVYGVMEFAGFEKFNAAQVKFVQELSLIIARTIFNIKVNERTRRLLAESQSMSNELQEQQEILRQNAEEMEATQEELKRTNHRLEDQIEEVNRTQKRMQLLLENASEVITIYEEDGTVRYISPSVNKILGYNQNELIGQKDLRHVHAEGVEAVENMFRKLLINPREPVTIQYIYMRKDGAPIWLEATGNNLLSDPAIKGIIVNSRDITERRRAEQEERMRSKMQSLSENSPDLITRFDNEGNFFYINPVIESYTGMKPDQFLNKNYSQVGLPDSIVNQWANILQLIKTEQQKKDLEMTFPSAEIGERVMQVNAIPEFDDKNALESVLVVSHDITERKLIELEIQSKNKSITESINYAKRIQGAILPDTKLINKELPESFIFYKARDVVSGDFPWFQQQGDNIFIAAVDCTGHGVPGALISLIGYFILNEIIKSRRENDPGKILDLLDEGVTETLRQDQLEAATKDGMDISLCKINLKEGTLEYAGAHRPLYILRNDELEEIKGNKFAIGGGVYRNQTKFSNNLIKIEKGMSVFFCSDGFPDQFGGPENRKFGPKRLRELIMETREMEISDVYKEIEDRWMSWKGEQKQTDDVLMIGIRF